MTPAAQIASALLAMFLGFIAVAAACWAIETVYERRKREIVSAPPDQLKVS